MIKFLLQCISSDNLAALKGFMSIYITISAWLGNVIFSEFLLLFIHQNKYFSSLFTVLYIVLFSICRRYLVEFYRIWIYIRWKRKYKFCNNKGSSILDNCSILCNCYKLQDKESFHIDNGKLFVVAIVNVGLIHNIKLHWTQVDKIDFVQGF